jgi:tetratricopeptide (TPR) repeat protein
MSKLTMWWLALAIGGMTQTPATAPIALLAPARIDPAVIVRAYNDAIVKDGTIDGIVKRLTDASADQSKPKRYRANACLVRSHLLWRHGRMAPAIAAVDEGLAIDAYDDLVYHKARLLDASGVKDQAREWYQKALAQTASVQLKETIRLRLTLVDAVDQNVKGLIELAKTRPRDFRNRAAIALAILGFNREAADLYEIFGDAGERYHQYVRVAQWAIRGGNAERAQEQAWQAVQAATLDRDRRYALSLLVEAHTLDKSLPRLLDRFGQQARLSADEERVRIDLLRQTAQYQKAIDLFRSAHGSALDADLRQELLRMYRDAGQDAAMIAEYRQLIAREPDVTEWPEGLSQYYLEQGDPRNARLVWEDFLQGHTAVTMLLAGAESMTSFGLHDLALAATEKALAAGAETAPRVRLAQFDLYRRRGMNTEAEASLASLDALVPPNSPYRLELADAYERLQKPQLAAKALEGLSTANGGLGADDTMRLAWLFDSIGRRDDA